MEGKDILFGGNLTLKEKLCDVLLSCLMYGANVKNGEMYEERIQKKMKLEYVFDPTRIRCCLDLIQDTESAIEEFAKYGLQKFKLGKINGDGEMYLRLYGILNAIYLQMQAIIELFEVLKSPAKKGAIRKFKELKIYEIRNIAGSHTVNYLDGDNADFNKNFFRITHISITAKSEGMYAVDGFHNIRELNLYKSFLEYNEVSEKLLFDCVLQYFNKIILSQKKRNEILDHYGIYGYEMTDYEKIYRNDLRYKKELKKFRKKLEEDLKTSDGSDFDLKFENLTVEEYHQKFCINYHLLKKEFEDFEKSINKNNDPPLKIQKGKRKD